MRLKDFLRYNILGITYMLVILFLCLMPTRHFISDLGFFEMDKLVHVVMFGSLTFLNRWGLSRFFARQGIKASPLLLAAIISVSYGLLIEVLQHLLPTGRTFELYDIIADIAGVLLAAILCRYVHGYR